MRFLENGPDIPDELLHAHEEGRVVFFCGSGVSRAKAGLPDFLQLAKAVVEDLGSSNGSAARNILKQMGEPENSGLISADRVFGALEREFISSDVETSVAKALDPGKTPDVSAHVNLLKLATAVNGEIRLVTTNFDRLFECCGQKVETWVAPHLPSHNANSKLSGLVYLHGCVDENYDSANGDGWVLSISQFGRAYLSEAWAASFVKDVLRQYVVVFIGYSADDPPIQYLLEGLNSGFRDRDKVYAFQGIGEGIRDEEVVNHWESRGVRPIQYDVMNKHDALWGSIEEWVKYANDKDDWIRKLLQLASNGPRDLAPYQRGQVVSLMSNPRSVQMLLKSEPCLPVEWLCVFTPSDRYSKPGYEWSEEKRKSLLDPFECYGLDKDTQPQNVDPERPFEQRYVPPGAIDVLALNTFDNIRKPLKGVHSIYGKRTRQNSPLPTRLTHIGSWISELSNHPAVIWWAARNGPVHPQLQDMILFRLSDSNYEIDDGLRKAWNLLIEGWSAVSERSANLIADEVKKRGWNGLTSKKLSEYLCPRFKVSQNPFRPSLSPTYEEGVCLGDILIFEVEYPDWPRNLEVPDIELAPLLRYLRHNLDLACQMEAEIAWGRPRVHAIPSIRYDPKKDNGSVSRTQGVGAHIVEFSKLFKRLAEFNPVLAHQEFASWPRGEADIFGKLIIWAAHLPSVLPAAEFCDVICQLPAQTIWNFYNRKDFLWTLRDRWEELGSGAHEEIERLIHKGPPQRREESTEEYEVRRKETALRVLSWLLLHGCQLGLKNEFEVLKEQHTDWSPGYGSHIDQYSGVRSGWVEDDESYDDLLTGPLETIVDRSERIGVDEGRRYVNRVPFRGLVKHQPQRAFDALKVAKASKESIRRAWAVFLDEDLRKEDCVQFMSSIGQGILELNRPTLVELLPSISHWLLNVAEGLSGYDAKLFELLFTQAVDLVSEYHASASNVHQNKEENRDWAFEALNHPVGDLARALLEDSSCKDLERECGLPSKWVENAELLLTLEEDPGRYALLMLSHQLNWLYSIDRAWCEDRLLKMQAEGTDEQVQAFWSGCFWGLRGPPSVELYFRLKPDLLNLARELPRSLSGDSDTLASILLSGWISKSDETGKQFVSNDELRHVLLDTDDEFRGRVLWLLRSWNKEQSSRSFFDTFEKLVLCFLKNVWPKQKTLKNGAMSERLCDLVFECGDFFPIALNAIAPLLTKIRDSRTNLIGLHPGSEGVDLVKRYPEEVVRLLSIILPDDAQTWPWDIRSILDRILNAQPRLAGDVRMKGLQLVLATTA